MKADAIVLAALRPFADCSAAEWDAVEKAVETAGGIRAVSASPHAIIEKAAKKFSSRSEAGRYAAQQRWGKRSGDARGTGQVTTTPASAPKPAPIASSSASTETPIPFRAAERALQTKGSALADSVGQPRPDNGMSFDRDAKREEAASRKRAVDEIVGQATERLRNGDPRNPRIMEIHHSEARLAMATAKTDIADWTRIHGATNPNTLRAAARYEAYKLVVSAYGAARKKMQEG